MNLLKDSKTFMAIFAHCDDVEIAMVDLFREMIREGKRGVYVVCVDNAYVREGFPVEDAAHALEIRRGEAQSSAEFLGADRIEFLELQSYYLSKTNREIVYPSFASAEKAHEELDGIHFHGKSPVLNAYTSTESRQALMDIIKEEKPDVIFTHAPDDRHQDHYCVARFASLLVEDLRNEGVSIELCFSAPAGGGSMAGFWPNQFVECSSEDVDKKAKATSMFVSQFRPEDSDDRAHRMCRAFGSVVDVKCAEAFTRGMWDRMFEPENSTIEKLIQGPPKTELWRL